jgi:hypothetical protein
MRFAFLIAAWFVASHVGSAQTRIVASGEIPSNARDAAGDTLGGIGSAIVVDSRTGQVLAMPDRGADDGNIPFRPRYHVLRIDRNSADSRRLDITVLKTVLFSDEAGRLMTGLLPDREVDGVPMRGAAMCLDPEAIAIGPQSPFTLLMAADNDFLAPKLHLDGDTHVFPRAIDAVPTQVFEIELDSK